MPPHRPSRKRFLSESSDDDDAAYPEALLESSRAPDIESPSKRQKNVDFTANKTKPRKGRPAQRQAQVADLEETRIDTPQDPGQPASTVHALHEQPYEPFHEDYEHDAAQGEGWEVTGPGDEGLASHNEALDLFIESVSNGVVGFKHVHSKFCVVQGWDYQRQRSTVSTLHNLESLTLTMNNRGNGITSNMK